VPDVKKIITISEVKGIKVKELFFKTKHSITSDPSKNMNKFLCVNGMLEILTQEPLSSFVIRAGESFKALNKNVHAVKSYDGKPCRFMVIQTF